MGRASDITRNEVPGGMKGIRWGRPVDKFATVAAWAIIAAVVAGIAFVGTRSIAFAVAWYAIAAVLLAAWNLALDEEDRRALTCPGYVGLCRTHARAVLAFATAIVFMVIFAGILTVASIAVMTIIAG